MGQRERILGTLTASAAVAFFACQGVQPIPFRAVHANPDGGDAGDAGEPEDAGDAGVVDAGPDAGHDAGMPFVCNPMTQYVYTVASDNTLLRFSPENLTFTPIGLIRCPDVTGPFSMAVDHNAVAWVEYGDGLLFKVDTMTAACTPTSFVANQSSFQTFGMGFSANGPDPSMGETLYVSGSTGQPGQEVSTGLASIDTDSLVLSPIDNYPNLTGPGVNPAVVELTGTGDGRLFGAFEGTPFVLAEIDKAHAAILSEAPQNGINIPAGGAVNLAFAGYGGYFWFFVGPDTSTNVYRYDPATNTTRWMTRVSLVIVGAGVSTCAPGK